VNPRITCLPQTRQDDREAQPGGGLGALVTARGNLPLDRVDLRARITGTLAAVELAQGFRNPFDVPLEATYIFPLPYRAAVTGLRMEAGGHVVEATLKERAEARAAYDAAIGEGRRAAIAEEERPDVFTMRMGNIVPGERVTVRLSLSQPLPYEDGEATFRFPLVVAPRYIPGTVRPGSPAGPGVAADTDAVPDASRITPPVLLPGFPDPVRLTAVADIDPAGLPLTGITSSLPVRASDDAPNGHTIVRLEPGERLDRDFVLRLAVAQQEQVASSLSIACDEGRADEGTFTLTLLPPAGAAAARPRDVVIVLDRSGSMSGWKMVAARRAAARIVDTLTAADRFAVLCFDNVTERPPGLPAGLAEASDRHRFRAVEHLARTEARGGTQLLGPLQDATALLAPDGGRDRVLVLVTDGQVGNEDQILRLVGPQLAGVRVHLVGIDQAVNAGFLGRLATIGRGRCELVESEDRLDEAAERIHRRIGSPLVTALDITADGLRIVPGSIAPARLPDLLPGVPLTVAGRWQGSGEGSVIVRGTTSDGAPFEQAIRAAAGAAAAPGTAIWARAHLRDLEDRYASLAPASPDELRQLENQITGTSLRFGVLCRFTAWVAADTRVVTEGGVPHRVTQPVELPAGWDPEANGLPYPAEMFCEPAQPAGATAAAGAAPAPAPMFARAGRTGRGRPLRKPVSAAGFAGRREAAPGVPLVASASATKDDSAALAPGRARDQVREELAWLKAVPAEPGPELALLLADLGSRLAALVTWLSGLGVPSGQLAPLDKLAARLRASETATPDLAGLLDEALATLAVFAGEDPADTFWKRHV
jgi:Ca-activated chloride channel family protein